MRLMLAGAAMWLAGCGEGTTIALCSGSDEFCSGFFGRLGGADDPDEDAGEDAQSAAVPTAGDPLNAALELTRVTPAEIGDAIAATSMDTLVSERGDLVGLWLAQAALGLDLDPPGNAAATAFLDQNRAWLPAPGQPQLVVDEPSRPLLAAGLQIFASYARSMDPASAEAARSLAEALAVAYEKSPGGVIVSTLEPIVVDAADRLSHCCSEMSLAAAALVLCAESGSDQLALASRERACIEARRWYLNSVGLGDGSGGFASATGH